jgi:hypothetical protein
LFVIVVVFVCFFVLRAANKSCFEDRQTIPGLDASRRGIQILEMVIWEWGSKLFYFWLDCHFILFLMALQFKKTNNYMATQLVLFLHILSSWAKIRLCTENQLPRFSVSGLFFNTFF